MSDTSKTAKIIKRWYHSTAHWQLGDVMVNDITFLWFLLFSMCHSLHVAVNKCINWCFVHLFSLYFTHLPRSPQWMDLHEILHGGSSRWRNHLFQILCRSVEGFRICAGSNFAILHWFSWSPLTQGCATARLWCSFKKWKTIWRHVSGRSKGRGRRQTCHQMIYVDIVIIYLVECRRHAIVVATDTQETQG